MDDYGQICIELLSTENVISLQHLNHFSVAILTNTCCFIDTHAIQNDSILDLQLCQKSYKM